MRQMQSAARSALPENHGIHLISASNIWEKSHFPPMVSPRLNKSKTTGLKMSLIVINTKCTDTSKRASSFAI
jgi:hypothetical protein